MQGRDKDGTHRMPEEPIFSNSSMIFGKNKGNLIK
jgi:hypothetical protein